MKLGKRIAIVLKTLGKKQTWLCEQVTGLEIGTLSALINRDSARSEFAVAIAKATGARVEYLLDGELPMFIEDVSELSQDEIDLIKSYRQVNQAGRHVIQTMLRGLVEVEPIEKLLIKKIS